MFVGVVGRNFNPTAWDEPFDKTMHAVAARASDGEFFRKQMKMSTAKMAPIGTSDKNRRFQIELNMKEQNAVFNW